MGSGHEGIGFWRSRTLGMSLPSGNLTDVDLVIVCNHRQRLCACWTELKNQLRVPLTVERICGTHETVKARFWPWISEKKNSKHIKSFPSRSETAQLGGSVDNWVHIDVAPGSSTTFCDHKESYRAARYTGVCV